MKHLEPCNETINVYRTATAAVNTSSTQCQRLQ